MANWVDVLELAAPWNRLNINGIHPQIFELRARYGHRQEAAAVC
jgi:hypothetical protein